MFTKEDFRIPKLMLLLSPGMPQINIITEGVRQLTKNLHPFKAIGPDKA